MSHKILLQVCSLLFYNVAVCTAHEHNKEQDKFPVENVTLVVENNGPVVQDASMTFSAHIYDTTNGQTPEDPSMYQYVWQLQCDSNIGGGLVGHELCSPRHRPANYVSTLSFSIPSDEEVSFPAGHSYTMEVRVYQKTGGDALARNATSFNLTKTLNGALNIHQTNNPQSDSAGQSRPQGDPPANARRSTTYVALGRPFNLTASTYDPENFLDKASVRYEWSVDGAEVNRTRDGASVTLPGLNVSGRHEVGVRLVAEVPDRGRRWDNSPLVKRGEFTRSLLLQYPIANLSVEVDRNVRVGDDLHLALTCSGSPPWTLCHVLVPRSHGHGTNWTDLMTSCTASDAAVTHGRHDVNDLTTRVMRAESLSDCSFRASVRCARQGDLDLHLLLTNNVDVVRETVAVHVYTGGSSTVVWPIVAVVTASFLVTMVIGVAMRQAAVRRRAAGARSLQPEVASFDFPDPPSSSATNARLGRPRSFSALTQSVGDSVKSVTRSTAASVSKGSALLSRLTLPPRGRSYGTWAHLQDPAPSPRVV